MQRGTIGWRRKAAAAATVAALAAAVAACGGDDGGSDDATATGGGETAPGAVPKLSDKPIELTFLWFEWPPAQALEDFANENYAKERPNVTVKVNKDTKVKAKAAVKVEEIKAGTRVVITAAQEKEKSFTAKTIEDGAATAAAK